MKTSATGYGKSSSNVATNVSDTSNTVVASSVTTSVSIGNGIEKKKQVLPLVSQNCHLACVLN